MSRFERRLPQALQHFLDQVIWLNLEELGRRQPLDPLVDLLTLPVRPEAELSVHCRGILPRDPAAAAPADLG
ncbi:MAG: hypothetical protein NTV57_02560 [Cyanobacteria bacterium]|nr:hypothetical protein [Cyanobacteriota bacterium]